jgi:N-acetylneuraminic acid mutarotase
MAAGSIDGIIYVVGGLRRDFISRLARVDAYNVATNTWSQVASMPGARESPNGASVINGKLYVSGGRNREGNPTKTLFVYDPGSNRWARKADMPQAGCGGTQGVIDGQLYVYMPPIGGGSPCHGSSEVGLFFRYNPARDTWVRRAAAPNDHKQGAGRVINGKFYLAGGFRLHPCAVDGEPTFCDELHSQLDVYDPASNTWATKAPIPGNRHLMAAAVLNGKLFLVAGLGGFSDYALSTVEAYDPLTNRWTAKAPLPIGSAAGVAVTAAGRIVFISGTVVEDGNSEQQPWVAGPTEVYAYTP